jgi:hypothetical protein
MHFITSISLASSFIALTGAVPTLTERSINFCPDGQWYMSPELKCSSGFIGCVAQEKGDDVCSGQKRFNNDCFSTPGLGSFFNCPGNGFKGCTTNPSICDLKSSTSSSTSTDPAIQKTTVIPSVVPSVVPSLAPGSCRPGEGTFYNCATGFKGCSTDPTVCDPKPSNKPSVLPSVLPSTPTPVAPNSCQSWEGVFYNCANGFKGCSRDPTVCDKPAKPSTTPCASSTPIVSSVPTKPATPTPIPTGPATNPDCPFGGQFYVCAINGFRGCSTDPTICDPKPKTTTTPVAPVLSTPIICVLPTTTVTPVASGAAPKPTDMINPLPTTGKCSWQKGTQYVAPGQCSSGFVGCTGSELGDIKPVCDGPQRFWSTCPPNSGIYQNCATNGFVGCTTDVNVCDRKKGSF